MFDLVEIKVDLYFIVGNCDEWSCMDGFEYIREGERLGSLKSVLYIKSSYISCKIPTPIKQGRSIQSSYYMAVILES